MSALAPSCQLASNHSKVTSETPHIIRRSKPLAPDSIEYQPPADQYPDVFPAEAADGDEVDGAHD